jgi:hypothetical protein
MAMRHKAPPQAGCHGASSAPGCVQSQAAPPPPKTAPDRCAISAHVTSQFALAGLTATNDAGKPGIQQMEPTFASPKYLAKVTADYAQAQITARTECEAWSDADPAAKSKYLAANDGFTPLDNRDLMFTLYAEILEAACEALQQRRSDEANELTDILSDASMASILTDYAAWLVTAQVDYKAWTTANEAFQRRYCANHGGRNAPQHHKFIATLYADFFEAAIEAMPAERQLAMSANVRAVGVLAILDSGAGHLYADGAGQILRPCSPLTAQQAGGTSMHTDREWDFELFVKDHKDQVYRLHSPARHVPNLGGHMPFCIIPPSHILRDGGAWNNSGLHNSYIRVAIPGGTSRDPRLSGKIPISWELGVSTFIPVPEHLRTKGDIISVCISANTAGK